MCIRDSRFQLEVAGHPAQRRPDGPRDAGRRPLHGDGAGYAGPRGGPAGTLPRERCKGEAQEIAAGGPPAERCGFRVAQRAALWQARLGRTGAP
eukprot:254740-Alexandrium_andersonii.AAC.1